MARRKQTVSFSIHPALAARFREATKEYFGKLGLCLSAGMLMFLESDPELQSKYMRRVFEAEISDEVEATVDSAKAEQLKKITTRENSPKSKRGS